MLNDIIGVFLFAVFNVVAIDMIVRRHNKQMLSNIFESMQSFRLEVRQSLADNAESLWCAQKVMELLRGNVNHIADAIAAMDRAHVPSQQEPLRLSRETDGQMSVAPLPERLSPRKALEGPALEAEQSKVLELY